MARVFDLQASFAGGEISPRLYGRSDLIKYETGAEVIENFIVRPEGGLMRRHGTRFAGECKTHSAESRLVPFIFSSVQAYVLEFGNLYMRVWKDYGIVVSATNSITGVTNANPAVVTYSGADNFANGDKVIISGVVGMTQLNNREFEVANLNAGANTFELSGVNSTSYGTYTSGGSVSKIFQLTTPYVTADLETLSFAQSADTLFVAHENYQPRTITRTADTTWTIATITQEKGPFSSLNTDTTQHVYCTVTGSNYDKGDSVDIKSNAAIFTSGHVGSYMYLEERYYGDNDVVPYPTQNVVAPSIGDQISNNGNVYEVTAQTGADFYPHQPWTHTDGDMWNSPPWTHRTKGRYLHSRWSIISLDTYTDANNMSGTIQTRLPNGLAPSSKNITNVTNSGGICRVTSNGHGYSTGDYVYITGVGGATQANGSWRIINAATNTFDLEGSSAPSAYTSGGTVKRYATWKYRFGAFSDARGWPSSVTLHEQRLVWGGTSTEPFGVWMSRSGDFYNHLPGTADDDAVQYAIAAPQVNVIRWLESSGNLLIGTLAQEFAAFGGGLGDPITPSNTRIVPQSNEGSAAIQPARAGNEVVFINRSGRKIYALDFDAAGSHYIANDLTEIAAHLTATGQTFTRVAWARNPASVLWALRSDGVLCSLTYRKDQQVWAWARHPLSDGTVESIAVIPSPDGTVDDLWMIVNRTVNSATKRYVEYLAQPFEPSSATDKEEMAFVDSGLRYQGSSTSTLTGLFHLEGKTVKVLRNGTLHSDEVVTNGSITLDSATTDAWVGLSYTSKVRTLRPELSVSNGTYQGQTKRVSRAVVRVYNSMGGKVSDASEAVYENLIHRDMADLMDTSPPLRSGDYDVNLSSDYDTDGRVTVVQTEPLPLDILAVIAGLTIGGE
jgi:hypothetical protein